LIPGFFLRQAGTDAAHVKLLADAAASVQLPPILVQKNSSRIIDGMHRFEAAKLCRQQNIRAHVIGCTDEEALILAVRSNTLHGLPLSRADRIAGAKRILSANPDWSDRALAKVTGLSTRTIGVLRNRSTDDIPVIDKRLGRDGKRRH
jgi:ParB-like chromosome segregation protein Spo0J